MALREQLLSSKDTIARAAVPVQGTMKRFYERYSWMQPPLIIAFGVRAILLVAAQIGIRLVPGQQEHGIFNIWYRYDAVWYISIAQNGYQYPVLPKSDVNFFPLYPLTIWVGQHILSPILGTRADLLVAMGISWVAFAAACVILYRMLSQRFDQQVAFLTILLLATFPFSFYYGAAYTESLYLLMTVVAFYAIERHAWWLAGAAALFASGIRPPGLIVGACVVLAYALDWIQQRRPLRWNVLALALTPFGALAYALYCWVRFGDPLAYVKASQQGWNGGHLQLGAIHWFVSLLTNPKSWIISGDFSTIVWTIYAFLFIATLIGAIFIYRTLGPVYAFFTVASIIAPVLSYTVPTSTGRYVSVIFPIFIVLALYLRKRPALREVVVISFSIFLALFAFLFVMNRPIY